MSSGEDNNFVNGAVIAAARTLPTWSDGDMPPIPSLERKAARELQEECHQMLAEFPTTSQEDLQILGTIMQNIEQMNCQYLKPHLNLLLISGRI